LKNLILIPKFNFSYFLVPALTKKRERHQFLVEKRENHHLTLILTMKKIDLGINEFYSTREVALKCSFAFPLPKRVDLSS
jgi:hypothetical protein